MSHNTSSYLLQNKSVIRITHNVLCAKMSFLQNVSGNVLPKNDSWSEVIAAVSKRWVQLIAEMSVIIITRSTLMTSDFVYYSSLLFILIYTLENNLCKLIYTLITIWHQVFTFTSFWFRMFTRFTLTLNLSLFLRTAVPTDTNKNDQPAK